MTERPSLHPAVCSVSESVRRRALIGCILAVDERILETANGSNRAMYPSVVFRVFIDGQEAASSPVMRISEQPWRFDVPIPAEAKLISLVATDAGDGNKEDLANWASCGFVLHGEANRNGG